MKTTRTLRSQLSRTFFPPSLQTPLFVAMSASESGSLVDGSGAGVAIRNAPAEEGAAVLEGATAVARAPSSSTLAPPVPSSADFATGPALPPVDWKENISNIINEATASIRSISDRVPRSRAGLTAVSRTRPRSNGSGSSKPQRRPEHVFRERDGNGDGYYQASPSSTETHVASSLQRELDRLTRQLERHDSALESLIRGPVSSAAHRVGSIERELDGVVRASSQQERALEKLRTSIAVAEEEQACLARA